MPVGYGSAKTPISQYRGNGQYAGRGYCRSAGPAKCYSTKVSFLLLGALAAACSLAVEFLVAMLIAKCYCTQDAPKPSDSRYPSGIQAPQVANTELFLL